MKAGTLIFILVILLISSGFLMSQYITAEKQMAALRSEMGQLQQRNTELSSQVTLLSEEYNVLQALYEEEHQALSSCQSQINEPKNQYYPEANTLPTTGVAVPTMKLLDMIKLEDLILGCFILMMAELALLVKEIIKLKTYKK